MSGRKRFNEDEALDAAMMAFWRRGYEATSMCELEQATGLNKSSLYNAFASKEALFARCLDRYRDRYRGAVLERLDAPRFPSAIEDFFDRLLHRFDDDSLPRGCLMTMTAMEVVGGCDAIAGRVAQNAVALQQVLASRIERAKSDGELPVGLNTEAFAGLLTAVARGISVLDRSCQGQDIAKSAVQGILLMIHGIATEKPGKMSES